MNGASGLAAFLACAAIGISAALHAQPRGPSDRAVRSGEQRVERPPLVVDEATRSRRVEEMKVWLGRLVGRFRVDAKYTYVGGEDSFYVTAMCDRFGEGPGARCIIQRTGPSPVMRSPVFRSEGVREDVTLPLLYFGINPEDLEVQAVVVDLEQVGAQSGVLTGDSVSFSDNWNACIKTWAYCWMGAEIIAKAAGEIVMRFAVDHWFQGSKGPPIALLKSGHTAELEMHLFREPLVDAQAPRSAP